MIKCLRWVVVIFILTTPMACANDNNNNQDHNNYNVNNYADITTLYVLVHELNLPLVRFAETLMAARWYDTGRGEFRLNLSIFDSENALEQFTRLNVMLMAGQGYDMFAISPRTVSRYAKTVFSYAQTGFLKDINVLIDQCIYRNHDDYFINVFNMFSIDERLYGFPLAFSFSYVAINANAPDSLISRFKEYDFISMNQLISLYLYLIDEHPDDFGHFIIGNDIMFINLYHIILRTANDFVDFQNNTSNLLDEYFIFFIENINRLFPYFGRFNPPERNFGVISQNDMRVRANQNLFVIFSDDTIVNALIPPDNPYFLHFIPISNNNDELIATVELLFCFPRAGNYHLAWEFTQHLQNAFATMNPRQSLAGASRLDTAISQEFFTVNVIYSLQHHIFDEIRYRIDEHIDNAIAMLYMHNQMPISIYPILPIRFIHEAIFPLQHGIITPREAVQRLHNIVALWLIE